MSFFRFCITVTKVIAGNKVGQLAKNIAQSVAMIKQKVRELYHQTQKSFKCITDRAKSYQSTMLMAL